MSIPPEAFVLPPATRGSLQQRIRQMVTEGVLAGRFRAGQKMPSSRGLAQHLGISRITVTLAYADLVSSDYLTSQGRSGYFVSETAPLAPEFPAGPLRAEAIDFKGLTGGRFTLVPKVERPEDWRAYPYPFIYGQADPALFDHQNWRPCAVQALGRRGIFVRMPFVAPHDRCIRVSCGDAAALAAFAEALPAALAEARG